MTDNLPLVSIIVPSYNHELFISDCIQGLLNQTYNNIEVIIIDDASSDNSFSLIESFKVALESRFIRTIIRKHEHNHGTAYTLNEMIELSQGKYIETTASDDILCSDAVEKFVAVCENNEHCSLAYSNIIELSENNHFPIVNELKEHVWIDTPQPSGGGITPKLLCGNFISGATSFIPRKTIEKIGNFDINTFCEDWDFNIRASLQGEIEYLSQALVMCHVTKNSKCRNDESQGKKKARLLHNDAVYIFNKYKKYADHNVSSKFFSNQLALAVGVDDWELSSDIKKKMKSEKLQIILPLKDRIYIDILLSPLGKISRKR